MHIWEPRPLEEQILEVFFKGIEEMKAADIGTVDPESLVDVTGILISSDGISLKDRFEQFARTL